MQGFYDVNRVLFVAGISLLVGMLLIAVTVHYQDQLNTYDSGIPVPSILIADHF